MELRTVSLRPYGILLFLLFAGIVQADFQILWSDVNGGGGSATSGSLSLDGTIGQPAAGVSEDGRLVLNAGYQAGSCGCSVNLSDLLIFCEAWLTDDAELNLSGVPEINLDDFSILAQNWMGDCPAGWSLK